MGSFCPTNANDSGRGALVHTGNKKQSSEEPVGDRPRPTSFIGHRDKKLVRDYILGAQLGQGAFGEVRECQHKETKAKRAVKILRKVRLDEGEKTKMMNEIDNLKLLDHPNILRMYESYECEKRYYIVTDISRGGELFDEIAKNKFFTEPNA